MTNPTTSILADAARTFMTTDSRGRSIVIRKIGALDRLRLLKAAGPDLSQNDPWLNMAALAASVVEVDAIPRVFPTSERQIENMVAELGDDGLLAVAEQLTREANGSALFDGRPEGNVLGTPS